MSEQELYMMSEEKAKVSGPPWGTEPDAMRPLPHFETSLNVKRSSPKLWEL